MRGMVIKSKVVVDVSSVVGYCKSFGFISLLLVRKSQTFQLAS